MTRATAVIRLTGEHFNSERFSCTGEQLGIILDRLKPLIKSCDWYIADLENIPGPTNSLYESHKPVLIGSTEALLDFTRTVSQFSSGIFLAVPNINSVVHWERSFWTDDEPFQELDEAFLEIRAFDTSYFEIYAERADLIRDLANSFGAVILFATSDSSE